MEYHCEHGFDGTGVRRWLALPKPSRLAVALRNESGSVLIETALGFMLMMAMVLGIIESCMMVYTLGVLEDAAREGVRYASVHGTDSTNCSGPTVGCTDSTYANVVNAVTSYAGQFSGILSGMSVSVTYPDGTSAPTARVQVAIRYTYTPHFFFPGVNHVMQISSQGRIAY